MAQVMAPRHAGGETRGGWLARRWFGLVGFLLLFGVCAAWSYATPIFAAPDEPTHIVRAASVAHGQLIGKRISGTANTTVKIPATIAGAVSARVCYAFQPNVTAACMRPFHTRSGTVGWSTYVGRYPPLYYFLVGLPSTLVHTPAVFYLMRLVSGALSALFLAIAFVAAARARRARFAALGVAVAATPMVIFLAAVINPSGLEISSAVCVWACGLVLFSEPDHPDRCWLIAGTAVSAAVLVQMRGLSPLLLAIIALCLGLVVGRRRVVALLRGRAAQIAAGIVLAWGVFAVAWIFAFGSLNLAPAGIPVKPGTSEGWIVRTAFHRALTQVKEMGGLFGWKDTPAPHFTLYIWAVLAALLVAACILRNLRMAAVVLLLCVLTVAVPALLSISQAHKVGIVGQARYIMPVTVGVPIISAYALSVRDRWERWAPLALLLGAVLLALAQGGAFVEALRRYRTGLDGAIFARNAAWAPPGGTLLIAGLFAVCDVLLYAWWWWLTARRSGPQETGQRAEAGGPHGVSSTAGQQA